MTNWRQTSVAADATHHLLAGLALYSERFDEVLKFHEPGLAPVRRGDEAWHIDVSGMPAYRQRFRRTFGFYEHRAAVQAATGWCHIRPDGSLVGQGGLAWCGNFQEGRCTVRAEDGLFFHVDLDGAPICAGRHLYVGDYRDGLAVVRGRDDGLCTHVDLAGRETHRKRFLDLDVFHKGMARARDGAGWFHIGLDGRAAYEARFENVEPFYNGLALAWTWSGSRVLIDRAAVVRHVVTPVAGRAVTQGRRSSCSATSAPARPPWHGHWPSTSGGGSHRSMTVDDHMGMARRQGNSAPGLHSSKSPRVREPW